MNQLTSPGSFRSRNSLLWFKSYTNRPRLSPSALSQTRPPPGNRVSGHRARCLSRTDYCHTVTTSGFRVRSWLHQEEPAQDDSFCRGISRGGDCRHAIATIELVSFSRAAAAKTSRFNATSTRKCLASRAGACGSCTSASTQCFTSVPRSRKKPDALIRQELAILRSKGDVPARFFRV